MRAPAVILFVFWICVFSKTDRAPVISLYEPLKIVSPKNSPPYYAYLDLVDSDSLQNKVVATNANAAMADSKEFPLVAGTAIAAAFAATRLILPEMIIQKMESRQIAHAQVLDESWKDQLTSRELERLARVEPKWIEEDWKDIGWKQHVNKILRDNGVIKSTSKSTNAETNTNNFAPPGQRRVQGPIEMCCGLALTNQHRFDIRRYFEGMPREVGTVDTHTGIFHINIKEPLGEIIATLADDKGRVIGEGTYKLTDKYFDPISGIISVPTIQLAPKNRFPGGARSIYYESAKSPPPPPRDTRVYGADKEKGLPMSRQGTFGDARYSSFSSSSVEAVAPQHWVTSSILLAGSENKVILFPDKFIKSIETLLRDEPVFQYSDPIETLVWGKTIQDGKPASGIRVEIEGDPTGRVFYLNEFYFPDPNLKTTSSSGSYVIVNARYGFQSILAYRGSDMFGYVNTVVKRKAVALGNIESSTKITPTSIRVFDAFAGEPLSAQLQLQSLPQSIRIEEQQTVPLPQVDRIGFLITDQIETIESSPIPGEYLSAQYLYQDSRGFIRVPGIKARWLDQLKVDHKINTNPNAGIVVGFFDEDDFQVTVAGQSDEPDVEYSVLYFDSSGNTIPDKVGRSGGGFVIFNLPADTQDIIVRSKNSESLSSQLVPVTPERISVLNF